MSQVSTPSIGDRITGERLPHRLERLRAWLDTEDLDCLVAFGPDEVNYLTGYSRYYGGPSGVVVDRDGERTLVVMRDEVSVAESLGQADAVLGFGVRGFGIELSPAPLLAEVVASIPALAGATRAGFADGLGGMEGLFASRVGAALVPAAAQLVHLRLRKDEDELARMLHAYELCWLGQRAVAEAAADGASEIEMFTAALATAQIAHGEPIEFLADLLAGEATAEVCCPIRIAGTRRVAPGEPVIADVVVRANGYWGDTAETHVVGSNPEAAAARAGLLEILEQARQELVPGATGAAIFQAMAARIADTFPGGEFPHHGGHAAGLTSFEDPHLIPSDETPLETWMAIAVEPGVYFPGRFGARVENIFVVTPSGGVELRDAFGVARG
ncbi:MAG: M24 family metallopeptidase [Gaiellales bacterium]